MPFGGIELVLLLVLVLVFFGPGRLPKAGEAIGRSIGDLRRAANDTGRSESSEGEADASAQR
jgi:sec-independent protein translocase protein TatA